MGEGRAPSAALYGRRNLSRCFGVLLGMPAPLASAATAHEREAQTSRDRAATPQRKQTDADVGHGRKGPHSTASVCERLADTRLQVGPGGKGREFLSVKRFQSGPSRDAGWDAELCCPGQRGIQHGTASCPTGREGTRLRDTPQPRENE